MKISLRELAETPRRVSLPLIAEWIFAALQRGHPDAIGARDGIFVGQGYLTNQGAVIEGRIEIEFTARCARCLAEIDMQAKLPCRWLLTRDAELFRDDPDALPIDGGGGVDLERPLSEAIDLGVPSVMLCSGDCAGLCPRCGADLNRGPCGCEKEPE